MMVMDMIQNADTRKNQQEISKIMDQIQFCSPVQTSEQEERELKKFVDHGIMRRFFPNMITD